ncbi:MAG TPA: DUF5777 family beta-barrel protein [Flavisolibacter sp.]|jgi:hypothetical protein|nr:DUF5777 family beta-barrel protein [Flavisolibacter sp.]
MLQPKHCCLALMLLLGRISFAQDDDMSKLIGADSTQKNYVEGSFKSTRVIMSHSVEMLHPGVLDFRILHRFGNVNRGLYEFFGLDQATLRLGLDYGVSKNVTIGIGRANYKKELDGFIKYRPIQQSTGYKAIPFSLVAVAGSTITTLRPADPTQKKSFSSRLAYYGQLVVGRKFSESFTLQVMPTFLHRNVVASTGDHNDLYAAGIGGRLKLSRRVSLNVDYYYVANQDDGKGLHNPLSLGFDIETGGHVFQLHFTNAIGMNERAFLAETSNDWGKGDIQFGFNISRAFQIKKRKI